MLEDVKVKSIELPFAKGMVTDYGTHLMPSSYSPYSKNVRVNNSTIVKRKGYKKVASVNNNVPISNLISAWGKLFAIVWVDLYEIDPEAGTYTLRLAEVWAVWDEIYGVSYWQFLVITNGSDAWRVWDTKDNVARALTDVYDDMYPRFWATFAHNIYLVWGWNFSNVVFKSRAGIAEQAIDNQSEDSTAEHVSDVWQPENIYNFTWPGSALYAYASKITGIISNNSSLFVFTETSIEQMDIAEGVWWVMTIKSIPIAGQNVPANPRMIVKADDLIFFRTKDNMMKSIWYVQWITDVVVGEITHRSNLSMKAFCETLDEDQSSSFWYYNRKEKTVHWHLKQKGEPFPNVVLVYDVWTNSFFIDTNKYFRCEVNHGTKYYVWDSSVQTVYEDDVGDTDNGNPIQWERKTALYTMWSPDYRKEFRIVNVYWEKDDDVWIDITVVIDGKEVFTWLIQPVWLPMSWTASKATATKPIAFEYDEPSLKPFEYLITRGSLRYRGKNIQIIFRWESSWDFCLSGLEIWYKDLYDAKMADKAKKKQ